jgi:hypothetical protein
LNKALVAKKKETRYRGELRLRDIGVATPKLDHTPNRTRTEGVVARVARVGLQNLSKPQISRVMTEGGASADSIGMFSLLAVVPPPAPDIVNNVTIVSGCRALPPPVGSAWSLRSNPRNDFRIVQARSTRGGFGISCFRPVSHANRSSCLSWNLQPEPSFSQVGRWSAPHRLPAATTTNLSVQQPAQRGVSFAILLVIRSSLPLHFPGRSGSYPHLAQRRTQVVYNSRVMDVFVLAGPTTSSTIDRPSGNTFLSAYDSMSRGEK